MSTVSISAEELKEGMRLLAGAVCLVTTDGPGGKGGITATAVCSVTAEPPTLLVCVNRQTEFNAMVKANGCFGVSVLADRHKGLSDRFAGFDARLSMAERFDEGEWRARSSGAPLLAGALASFDCQLDLTQEAGTHSVFFGRIVEAAASASSPAQPLIYFDRGYRTLV